jgi:cobalt/nickel transport protein
MSKIATLAWLGVLLGQLISGPARAHFLELIPSTDIVTQDGGRLVTVEATFTHPFERGPAMEMARPAVFAVRVGEARLDLLSQLARREVDGRSAYAVTYKLDRPGDHVFFVEPAPYWEPAEGVMIVHYTKVVVDGFGAEDGWDRVVGLPVEIEPLVRPYGLWSGNAFSGIVRKNGKPVPSATVEVEYRNDGQVTAPSDPFITQVVKTDANGVFTYAMPRAGWWGFAALVEGDNPMKNPDGKEVPVELGGLMWVRTVAMGPRE